MQRRSLPSMNSESEGQNGMNMGSMDRLSERPIQIRDNVSLFFFFILVLYQMIALLMRFFQDDDYSRSSIENNAVMPRSKLVSQYFASLLLHSLRAFLSYYLSTNG